MHHRNATAKLFGRLLEPKFKDNTRIYKGKDIKEDIYTDLNIDINYKQAWRAKNVVLEYISGCLVASFAQLPYYCHNLELTNDGTVTHIETDDEDRFKMVFIAFGVVIQSFKYHMRPLTIIDAAHLKGRYEGTNLLAVGMDGNNQIIPIATHAAILSSCEAVFPNAFHGYCCRHLMMNCKLKSIKMQCLFWKMCKAYTVKNFGMAVNELRSKRPDVYKKLIEAGFERWSRAYFPRDRYNYMTSNSAESINNLTRDVRKVSITNLMEWYIKLVQGCDWAKAKIRKRMQKSLNWVVIGIVVGRVYEVDDRRRIQTVELCNGTCTCRKWQVSGLPCGHVLVICRVIELTDCHRLAKGWFMRIALKGKSFHTQKTYPRGCSQQADDYLPNQCHGLLMLSTWMTLDAAYFMFLNEWKDNNVINLGFLGRHLLE
ncbi:transposase, MuDR, MULE transposase domain protein [Tanacetum coccineum]